MIKNYICMPWVTSIKFLTGEIWWKARARCGGANRVREQIGQGEGKRQTFPKHFGQTQTISLTLIWLSFFFFFKKNWNQKDFERFFFKDFLFLFCFCLKKNDFLKK